MNVLENRFPTLYEQLTKKIAQENMNPLVHKNVKTLKHDLYNVMMNDSELWA